MYRKEREILTPLRVKQKTVHKDVKKKKTLPQWEPTQSLNSTKVEGPSFINKLVSDQSELRKEVFSLWMDSASSSKAILFLVFQTV